MHAARENAADQNPEQAREIAELRGENRSEKGTRGSNSGEVVAEEHVLVRRHIVFAIIKAHGRGFAGGIDVEHLLSNP